jgi:hypothetical protein
VSDVDEAVARLRTELVEDAPPVVRILDYDYSIHAIRIRMRSRQVSLCVTPNGIEHVMGVRAFIDPIDTIVMVESIVADMRERVSVPFDIARWCVPRSYATFDLGLVSWLFPLEMRLRRADGEPVVDIMVVTIAAPDAAKFT